MIPKLKLFSLISYFNFLLASQLTIAPLFYSDYKSQGGTWKSEKSYSFLGGWGALVEFEQNNLSFHLDFYNNRIYNINQKPNFFTKDQGLSWYKRVDYNNNPTGTIFDFDVSNLKIDYKYNNFNLFFGKFNTNWGYGKSSLSISNKSPSFPKFGFNLKFNDKINFEYFHGALKSSVIDSLSQEHYSQDIINGDRYPTFNRYIAAHRLELKPYENLYLSFNEIVIYGVRNLDIYYCLPFIPFWSIQHYVGDLDNILMVFDFKYKITKYKNLYGSLLIDEWMPSKTFSKSNERNWFAYQLGLNFSKIFSNNDTFIAEYNWTDHRVYKHRYEINDFYNHNYPIGFWGGPHSQEFYVNYFFTKYNITYNFEFSSSKRGILTDEMVNNQYSNDNDDFIRFEDGHEKISTLQISISKDIYKALNAKIGVDFIDWENAGFNPNTLNNSNLFDIKKESFFLCLSYNYDFKKQESFLNKDSYKYVIN
tara:strand:+ start:52 stop:1485 length:1434 start_codon:yes stop_codon:yes gene_type:complete